MKIGTVATRAEQDVKTAADLYEARRAAKFLLGTSYAKTVQPYRNLIATAMKREGLPVLRAMLVLGTHIPPADGIPLMCLMAAAVDMCEEDGQ